MLLSRAITPWLINLNFVMKLDSDDDMSDNHFFEEGR